MDSESESRQIARLLEAAECDAAALREARIRRQAHSARMALFFLSLTHRVRSSRLARWLRAERAVDRYLDFALRQVEDLTAPQRPTSAATRAAYVEPLGEDPRFAPEENPTRTRLRALGKLDQHWSAIGELFLTASGKRTDEAFPVDEGATEDATGRDEAARTAKQRQVADTCGDLLLGYLHRLYAIETHRIYRLFSFGLPDLLRFLRKNLTLLWAIPLAWFVAFRIEAVESLLRNDLGHTQLYLALAVLPILGTRVTIFLLGRQRDPEFGKPRPVAPVWDIGGRAFRSLHPAVVEPNRLVERWPRSAEGIDPGLLDSGDEEVRQHARVFRAFAPPRKAGLERVVFWGQAARLLVYSLWWLLCGLGVWALTHSSEPYLTVYVIVTLLTALLVLAHVIDFWDFMDPRPVRFLMLLGGLGAMAMVWLGKEGYFWAPLLVLAIVYLIAYAKNRTRPLRAVIAALLLVATALSFSKQNTTEGESWRDPDGATQARLRLQGEHGPPQWPMGGSNDGPVVVMAASGGGSRAALYTAFTLEALHRDFEPIALRLQAISSVSGGSLANAAYTVRRLKHGASSKAVDDLAEAVGGDFLRPTLKGAATPGTSRGRSIEGHWDDPPVGLDNLPLSELTKRWIAALGGSQPPFPIPLFNTSTLDGHDVVISPLEKGFFTRDDHREIETEPGSTWVHNRDAVYGLDDLLPTYDPKLSSAVRASANFPFGFPLVWIQTTKRLSFSPLREDRNETDLKNVYLTDGGALSNSGMWSLANLLTNEALAERLRERGVLLVVVDASKMPEYPVRQRKLGTLWSAIGDQSPIGQALHRAMLDRLAGLYCNRIALLEVNLDPTRSANILTTWALSRANIEKLRLIFDERWPAASVKLEDRWRALTEAPDPDQPCGSLLETDRPPLD